MSAPCLGQKPAGQLKCSSHDGVYISREEVYLREKDMHKLGKFERRANTLSHTEHASHSPKQELSESVAFYNQPVWKPLGTKRLLWLKTFLGTIALLQGHDASCGNIG